MLTTNIDRSILSLIFGGSYALSPDSSVSYIAFPFKIEYHESNVTADIPVVLHGPSDSFLDMECRFPTAF